MFGGEEYERWLPIDGVLGVCLCSPLEVLLSWWWESSWASLGNVTGLVIVVTREQHIFLNHSLPDVNSSGESNPYTLGDLLY